MALRFPRDRFPYDRDPRSRPLRPGIPAGRYVYVLDRHEEVYVVPDTEPHLHKNILGGGQPARYAGDLILAEDDVVEEVTNLSGQFRFGRPGGLLAVAELLRARGLVVREGAVRWFHPSRGTVVVLA